MKSFPQDAQFIYEWRTYQQRALDELDHHLRNRHLHLVAPPGSGKTVLGLEVILRLNEPTLILAPTLTIKEQWVDRFVALFLNRTDVPDWISTDLKNPRFLTVTTYQALHSLVSNSVGYEAGAQIEEDAATAEVADEESRSDAASDIPAADEIDVTAKARIEAAIRDIGFQTIVLDEAHHLRSEWWKSAVEFRNGLDRPNVVALTATPPYDAAPAEWDRYIELCGPIDLEISVPELVKERDLCPHQDYIYFSAPTAEERNIIHTFRTNVGLVRNRLLEDEAFVRMIDSHPWIAQPNEHLEAILSNPGYFSSLLIFLKQTDSRRWERLIPILGTDQHSVPDLTLEWLEELLTGCLFQDEYTKNRDDILHELKQWLQQIGAVERRKVYLRTSSQINRILVSSVSKLQSVSDIFRFEAGVLQDRLRLVVLTDYIRLPDLPKSKEDEKPLHRLGVIPIFEKLRRDDKDPRLKLGVLTGSIAIIPADAVPALEASTPELEQERIRCTPLPHDERYVSFQMKGKQHQQLVRIITDLFTQGEIHVLIGTTALLGEGWDAPCINALILASYVGTFMLSNQMRGRAIRVQPGNEDKTSNIWHLVCHDPTQSERGYDMDILTRRFQSFVGVSYEGYRIESGIGRLELEAPPYDADTIERMNERTFRLAGNRQQLRHQWNEALGDKPKRMTEAFRTDPEVLPRPFILQNTIRMLLLQGLSLGSSVALSLLNSIDAHHRLPYQALLTFAVYALILGMIAALPKTVKAVRLLIKHGTIESSMKQVGLAVCDTLQHMNLIRTASKHLRIHADRDANGFVTCWMDGGTTYEKTLFLDAVQEAVGQIDNPRYLLVRQSKWGPVARTDYHAVPQHIGRAKDSAQYFCEAWKRIVGKAELIFTRNTEGRQRLLQARAKSMSSAFVKKSERISVWR